MLTMTASASSSRGRTIGRWTTAALVFGITTRSWMFLRDPPVWHDEAAMLVNVLEKGFAQLLGPLEYAEAAPPLFSWAERAMARFVGTGPFALRLIPFLASIAALLLVLPLTRQLRDSWTALIAVGLAAASSALTLFSVEAKPYAIDIFVATALPCAYFATAAWPLSRRLSLLSAAAPACIWLSYPGVFVVAAMLTAFALDCWTVRTTPAWTWWTTAAMVAGGAVLLLVIGPVRAQRTLDLESNWIRGFPNYSAPGSIPAWAVRQTIGIVDYCFRPIGGILLLPALVGVGAMWTRARATVVITLGGPIVLAFGAALVHAYPYAGSRVMAFALPGLAIFVAEGIGCVVHSIPPLRRAAVSAMLVAIVLAPPAVLAAHDVVRGWRRPDTAGAAAYVRRANGQGDRIASGHWEYRYYLHDIEPPTIDLTRQAMPRAPRVWLLVHGSTPAERQGFARGLAAAQWRVDHTHEFDGVSVVLLRAVDGS